MSLSSNDHISLYAAIDAAVSTLQLNSYNSLLEDFAKWGYDAEGKIGSTDTFKRFECELVVENNMACLPDNLVYMNALKVGNNWIDVTKRDFQMFKKGLATKSEPTPRRYISGNQVLSNPGQAGSTAIVFAGTYLTNDVITITITCTQGGTVTNHTFQYTVLPGDIMADIINQLAGQINAIFLPFSAQVNIGSNQLIINGRDATINFTLTLGTISVTGSMSQLVLQRRVAPTECDPCVDDTSLNQPRSGSVNLASRSAANLNNQMDGKLYMNELVGFNDFSASNAVHAVVNGHIHFNNISNGKVGISYMGFMLDDNGWVMVKNSHITAVAAYIVSKYIEREYYAGRMSQDRYVTADKNWHWECGQARGDDEMLDRNGMIYLSRMWNQMVPLPNKNLF